MSRHAFFLTIRPGMEEEYERRHREVWPELLAILKENGFRNYSIFRIERSLFGYMENDGDIEKAFQRLHAHPIQWKWRDYMSDVLVRNEMMGFTILCEVFHLD
jgi:L-rhamnose mutarotase